MPSWLAWLLPVPVATLLAALWITWQGRPRGPADPADSVREHQRFVAALSAPVDGSRPRTGRRSRHRAEGPGRP